MPKEAASANNVISDLTQSILHKYDHMCIFYQWAEIVGDEIATIAKPHKVVNSNNRKVLILKASPNSSIEALHETANIIKKINTFLSKDVFAYAKVIV